jgi:threonine synthase
MLVKCSECGFEESFDPRSWACRCGGPWESVDREPFDTARIDSRDQSIWRYRRFYGLDLQEPLIRLGAGWTPLISLSAGDRTIDFKLEFVSPTGSFKDRGTEMMLNCLARQGVRRIVDDSSGNAGASMAAYAARAGIQARVYVPAYASPAKQAQIAVYGTEVCPVPGPRGNATRASHQAAAEGWVYASHAYHPGYLVGQQSAAWELWEQLGRQGPDWILVPTAQGGNLLGYWFGFCRLQQAGLVNRMPRLVAVQAAAVAPICHAMEAGLDHVPAVDPIGTSVAEGLAVAHPVRGKRILEAIRESGGLCVQVQDDAILNAQERLARQGLWVEPTSATAVAALDSVMSRAQPGETIIVSLTGSGMKGKPAV